MSTVVARSFRHAINSKQAICDHVKKRIFTIQLDVDSKWLLFV